MAHEMAHVMLGHTFRATLVNERGCRISEPEDEKEAAELSGELLLPASAGKSLAYRMFTNEQAATTFQVSVDVARWRLDATGARKMAQRAHAKAGRR